jgi:hypothetical protein
LPERLPNRNASEWHPQQFPSHACAWKEHDEGKHSQLDGGNKPMSDPFDIFQKENGDNVLWQGAAQTLEEAKKRVRELGANSSSEYIILCRQTGTKLIVTPKNAGE